MHSFGKHKHFHVEEAGLRIHYVPSSFLSITYSIFTKNNFASANQWLTRSLTRLKSTAASILISGYIEYIADAYSIHCAQWRRERSWGADARRNQKFVEFLFMFFIRLFLYCLWHKPHARTNGTWAQKIFFADSTSTDVHREFNETIR